MYRYYNAHPQKLSVGDCGGKAVFAYYEITRFPRTYVGKKYCYTIRCEPDKRFCIAVYDGNGASSTKTLAVEQACEYLQRLSDRGLSEFDEIGEYI